MTIFDGIKLVLTRKATLNDVWCYLQGNYRYSIYYSKNKFVRLFMRKHIRSQIDYRIKWMDRDCLIQGQCKICGCDTTPLQMANKACEGFCYPQMLTRQQWKIFNNHLAIRAVTEKGKPERLWVKTGPYGRPRLMEKVNTDNYVQIHTNTARDNSGKEETKG